MEKNRSALIVNELVLNDVCQLASSHVKKSVRNQQQVDLTLWSRVSIIKHWWQVLSYVSRKENLLVKNEFVIDALEEKKFLPNADVKANWNFIGKLLFGSRVRNYYLTCSFLRVRILLHSTFSINNQCIIEFSNLIPSGTSKREKNLKCQEICFSLCIEQTVDYSLKDKLSWSTVIFFFLLNLFLTVHWRIIRQSIDSLNCQDRSMEFITFENVVSRCLRTICSDFILYRLRWMTSSFQLSLARTHFFFFFFFFLFANETLDTFTERFKSGRKNSQDAQSNVSFSCHH